MSGHEQAQPTLFSAISCPSVKFCMAVGGDAAERWNGRSWLPVSVVIPEQSLVFLTDVSCPSASSCEAVGTTDDLNGRPVVEGWNGKKWVLQTGVAGPAGAKFVTLGGVSCSKPVNCLTVGFYQRAAKLHLLAFHYA